MQGSVVGGAACHDLRGGTIGAAWWWVVVRGEGMMRGGIMSSTAYINGILAWTARGGLDGQTCAGTAVGVAAAVAQRWGQRGVARCQVKEGMDGVWGTVCGFEHELRAVRAFSQSPERGVDGHGKGSWPGAVSHVACRSGWLPC